MSKSYQFTINYFTDEDGVFVATVPALPGCMATGDTLEEAYDNVVAAIESCIAARTELDLPITADTYADKNHYRVTATV